MILKHYLMVRSYLFVRVNTILLSALIFTLSTLPLKAADIALKSVSIQKGIEGEAYREEGIRPKNIQQLSKTRHFKKFQELAQKAGLDLNYLLNQPAIAGFNSTSKNFFQLFYNTAIAPSCKRDYLIQRVKKSRSYYDSHDRLYEQTHEYLVEVFKTKNKALKGADQHYRSYTIRDAPKQSTLVEAEIGCGYIQNVTQGRKWPYGRDILYKEVQGYSFSPGVYNKVKYDYSQKYSFSAEFSENGLKSVRWPYFIR